MHAKVTMENVTSNVKQQPVVLIFSRYYLPGYRAGGVVRSLVNMITGLSDNFDFRIVTSDRDLGDSRPYPELSINKWEKVGKSWVYRTTNLSCAGTIKLAKDIDPDIIYLNSFFDPRYSLLQLWARRFGLIKGIPFIIACRGELSAGALSIKSRKKKAYLRVANSLNVYRNLTLHVSSALELQDVQILLRNSLDSLNSVRLAIARDLPTFRSNTQRKERLLSKERTAVLRVCFLSRISPIKNLDLALRVLQRVTCAVEFDIYGPIESQAYWRKCQAIIKELPDATKVNYCCEVRPENVLDVMSGYDLFFLPTGGENYGHVIHEALSAGLPVLLSDQTSWGNVELAGVGWCVPICDLARMGSVIEEVSRWDTEKAARVSRQAKTFALNQSAIDQDIEANICLFARALADQK